MPSSYGATSNPMPRQSPRTRRRAHRIARAAADPPGASILSSFSNLANTIIGSGALAFPSAFASMGLIPGFISCLVSACTAMFGLWCLSRCAELVGKRPGDEGRKASFNEVARLAFGKGWVMRLFDFAIAIKCFGVSVSYLIICKTLLPQVCQTFAHILKTPIEPDSILLVPTFWLLLTLPIIVPLSFMRTLDSLRFTSQIALSSVIYMVIVVVAWYFIKGPDPNRGEIVLGRFGTDTLASFPVQVFAFTCAQNLFPIYNELKDRSQGKMNLVIGSSIMSAASVYELLGVVGYLTFGSKVSSNVMAMYPSDSMVVAIGRLGIVFLVGLSYPLQALPCRSCLYLLTSGIIKGKKHKLLPQEPEPESESDDEDDASDSGISGHEQDMLVPKVGDGVRGPTAAEMPMKKYIGFTTGILVAGYLIAFLVDELDIVLSFVGSTGSTIISFILPGFFYFRLYRDQRGLTKWFALALGIYGVAVMTFCLTNNIIHLSRKPRAGH
ncbi:uncharacterized protein CcaverHIS019_0403360 [Cutaneotrichosporon cavernicola]|uniref:Amino acid transporter transmembrane domain-containing protein n=1 Tax=Cutaneotrichosporon cavernicola TaxID=279322 RepID=A0AA48QVP5_9TREE|nr:uncharacterized protein CcaverHIS019_0403360 [Cutaneotrichosporon cavernicola]BEI91516.1 hypothetical protein CcaverHIS019_0403360 [Cutaneotrichosporon cavernicola]BEI99291.1 hypothetical protein CcaverHIS631_0403340 [Cutaneotrichosporon cavernicola]BEJ07068.1 hypothetical protein CcaverHIS641_0403370 [Cutaneotrichosporon cavernicola]